MGGTGGTSSRAGWGRAVPLLVPGEVAGDRRGERREHPVGADRVDEPGRRQVVEEVLLDPREREHDAPRRELAVEPAEGVHAREVDLDVGLGVDDGHSTGCSASSTAAVARRWKSSALAKNRGSRSGRRRARDLPHLREVVDVVHAGHAGHVAEDAVVRPGHPAQHLPERQGDGEEDAVERTEHEHAQRRGDEEDQLTASEPRHAPDLGDVDEADRGVDDEGAEGRLRERPR